MPLKSIYAEVEYVPSDRADLALKLALELESWSDEISTGVVSHRVLRRAGAIHQQPLLPPRKTTFKGVILGNDVRARYVRMVDIVRAHPIGRLLHPRFQDTKVAIETIGADENPGEAIDSIEYQLRVEETGLADPPRPSPTAFCAMASERAQRLTALARARAAAFVAQAQALELATGGFGSIVRQSAIGSAGLLDLQAGLRMVQSAQLGFAAAPYILRVEAVRVFTESLQAYNRALAGRPPVVTHVVPSVILLARLCASLYGARLAKQMLADIRALNPPLPMILPSGFELLLPDPDAARRGLPTL